jgi:hypothetical protein
MISNELISKKIDHIFFSAKLSSEEEKETQQKNELPELNINTHKIKTKEDLLRIFDKLKEEFQFDNVDLFLK